jgi:hypothetical protein
MLPLSGIREERLNSTEPIRRSSLEWTPKDVLASEYVLLMTNTISGQ